MPRRTWRQARRSAPVCHRHDWRRRARPQDTAGTRSRHYAGRQGVSARAVSHAAAAPQADRRDGRARRRGNGRVGRLCRGDLTKMLDVSRGQRAGADLSSPRCRRPRARRSPAIPACSKLRRRAATIMSFWPRRRSNPRPLSRPAAAAAGVPLTFVGEAVEGIERPPRFIGPDGNPVVFEHGSYSHF